MSKAHWPRRIEGFALISREGMIADAERRFPEKLQNRADHEFFQEHLRGFAACVHGRHSHEGGQYADERARLVLTTTIPSLEPGTTWPRELLWNPAGAPFDDAWRALALGDGSLAVIGGTEVFGLFLEIGYDAFHLSRSEAHVPGGRPVFPEVPGRTPEDVLASFGMRPGALRVLDETAEVTVETWTRLRAPDVKG